MNKKIANVVFYKFWDPTREAAMQQACIFYEDGTIKNTTHEEGLEATFTVANAERLTGQQFRSMLNKERFYTMSGAEFERRFQEFIMASRESIASAVNAEMVNIEPTRVNGQVLAKTKRQNNNQTTSLVNKTPVNSFNANKTRVQNQQSDENTSLDDFYQHLTELADINKEKLNRLRESATNQPEHVMTEIDKLEEEADETQKKVAQQVQAILREKHGKQQEGQSVVNPKETTTTIQNNNQHLGEAEVQPRVQQEQQNNNSGRALIPKVPIIIPIDGQEETTTNNQRQQTRNNSRTSAQTQSNNQESTSNEENSQTTNTEEENNEDKPSLWQRIKRSKIGKRVTALLVAGSLLVGGIGLYHLGKNSKEGQIVNNNISLKQVDENITEAQDAAYISLLEKTNNEDLKRIMTKQGQNLDMYNRDFAAEYLETGKDVKAALSWDEVIALNLAYNDYTPEQIKLMFNGSNVDSLALTHAYKNAQLQLMGAYVISDRETPVNMAGFINSEEGKAFVEKYEDLFYDCKEATGDARVAAVNEFYQELFEDFPISDEVREVGLSHADSRKMVKNYMAAVAPMVAASEIMWQNLAIDHTLSDKATAYFNDIGLCNIAEDAFEKAETITLTAEVNEDVPTYQEFMNTKVTELMIEGNYVIDDAHRDLSRLDEFQKWVNGHFVFDENGYNTGVITRTETSTYTDTTYRTETSTHTTQNRDEAVKAAGEDAVREAEKNAQEKLDKENQANKEKGESEAEKNRQDLQEQADKEAEDLQDQVDKDNQDLQNKIDDANDNINNGGSVNEDDLGHGVDFDDDHSNSDGTLNDNVSDVTTDGSGAVDHDDPLPDPNETGQSFDQGGQTNNYSTADDYFEEGLGSYEEPYTASYEAPTNAQIVDQMIKDMEAQSSTNEPAIQYTK